MATLNARNYILSNSQKMSIQSVGGTSRRDLERYEMPIFTPAQVVYRNEGQDILDVGIHASIQEQTHKYDDGYGQGSDASDHTNSKRGCSADG